MVQADRRRKGSNAGGERDSLDLHKEGGRWRELPSPMNDCDEEFDYSPTTVSDWHYKRHIDEGNKNHQKERNERDKPREGWEDGTPPPHRDFKQPNTTCDGLPPSSLPALCSIRCKGKSGLSFKERSAT